MRLVQSVLRSNPAQRIIGTRTARFSSTFPTSASASSVPSPSSETSGSYDRMSSPAFSFNPNLHLRTIDPPVQIGAQWARSYPAASSPLRDAVSRGGFPLLNLAQGVPGHAPTSEFLERIAKETLSEFSHGYGPVFGHPAIRESVADDVNRFYRSPQEAGQRNAVKAENVGITAGCNLAFAAVAMSLAGPGEAIVVPTPWYFNHFMTLSSLGVETLPLATREPDFLPSAQELRDLLRESQKKVKAVILVTPNNPTGALYPPALIHEFARICRDAKIALLLDETYRDFVLSEDESRPPIGSPSGASGKAASRETSSASLTFGRPHDIFQETLETDMDWDWRQTVVHLFSFSKSYAIPGHRLGGIVAHAAFLQQVIETEREGENNGGGEKTTQIEFGPMAKALDNLQVAPPRTDTQRAIAWAMSDRGQVDWRLDTARELRDRRVEFIDGLQRKIPRRLAPDGSLLGSSHLDSGSEAKSPEEWGWKVESAGAYYAFVRHPFYETPSARVAEALATLVGVVTLPGTFFMPPGSPASQSEAANADGSATIPTTDSGARLRISIANVSTERLRDVPERLAMLSELWQIKGQGWGV